MFSVPFGPFSAFGGSDFDPGFLRGFLIGYIVFILLMSGYSLLVYILQSLGFYTVAQRRGIHHPWLAWIPFGVVWIMGSISDQYQYVAKGKVKNRRKVLLGLAIASSVIMIVLLVAVIFLVFAAMGTEFDPTMDESALILPLILTVVTELVLIVVGIISMVFQYVCYYDLFQSCNPDSSATLLVLGIFFSFLLPYFVFAVRKKDLGMPPRKSQPVAYQIPNVVNPAPVCQDVTQQGNYPE